MITFREFIKVDDFRYQLREELAAPPSGVPQSPSNPTSGGNDHHFDMTKRALGIGDDEFTAAIQSDSVTLYAPPTYARKWGFQCTKPVQTTIVDRDNGRYEVTFQLAIKKQMDPKCFVLPYKQGDPVVPYEGVVEDKVEIMTAQELQNAMAKPLENGGMQAGMGGDPMGGGGMGAPPMGGGMGAPPMGGGGMGAPPMGGM